MGVRSQISENTTNNSEIMSENPAVVPQNANAEPTSATSTNAVIDNLLMGTKQPAKEEPSTGKEKDKKSLSQDDIQQMIAESVQQALSHVLSTQLSGKKRKDVEENTSIKKDNSNMIDDDTDRDDLAVHKTKKAKVDAKTESSTKNDQSKKSESTSNNKQSATKNQDVNKRRATESDILEMEGLGETFKKFQQVREADPNQFHQEAVDELRQEVLERNAAIMRMVMDSYNTNNYKDIPADVQNELRDAFSSEAKFMNSPLIGAIQAHRHGAAHSLAEQQFRQLKNNNTPVRLNGYVSLPPIQQQPRAKETGFSQVVDYVSRNNKNFRHEETDEMDVDTDSFSYSSQHSGRNSIQDKLSKNSLQQKQNQNSLANRRVGFSNDQVPEVETTPDDALLQRNVTRLRAFINDQRENIPNSPFIVTQDSALTAFTQAAKQIDFLSTGMGNLFGNNHLKREALAHPTLEDMEYAWSNNKTIHPQVLHVALNNALRCGSGIPDEIKRGMNSSINFNAFTGATRDPFDGVKSSYY